MNSQKLVDTNKSNDNSKKTAYVDMKVRGSFFPGKRSKNKNSAGKCCHGSGGNCKSAS
ncbi:MAG: hypothetical protein K2Y22_03625 [Candidatus Obscuribacterales bacterium]|nr:hypothetical protein [Candidatus Obscuribacterales bacterium]